ncbi:uncharacterized protein BCR38DRAFT_60229 [Pseudomassariella vexata]|uniref:Uncharacterized protein n=1 Tax=Pseudomassariella vexata TaxID=1141098 RepID=A0A1Y2DK85_9PEZI|nr:uncharacterized protein BCR38DRAFT_60229 [Pseudomassariella vexata]ORY59621.1 hypothetical protein BCR38DRAFT_60229 [Pseudomassariella vexata]
MLKPLCLIGAWHCQPSCIQATVPTSTTMPFVLGPRWHTVNPVLSINLRLAAFVHSSRCWCKNQLAGHITRLRPSIDRHNVNLVESASAHIHAPIKSLNTPAIPPRAALGFLHMQVRSMVGQRRRYHDFRLDSIACL